MNKIKNKYIKNFVMIVIVITMLLSVTSCKKDDLDDKCEHNYEVATCTKPKTCSLCDATEGEALGHDWIDATCTEPKTCSLCSATEGEALGHDWVDATCTEPKTCSLCSATEGEALGHDWMEATYDAPKTCEICSKTEGNPLEKLSVRVNKEYISIGAFASITISGYDISEFTLTYSEEGIVSIDEWGGMRGLKKGTVTVTLTHNYNSSLKGSFTIEVISKMPVFYLLYDKMVVGDTTPIFFKNLDDLGTVSIEDFNVTFENGDVLSYENNEITAKSVGTETIKISLKEDDRVYTTYTVNVINPNTSIAIHGRDELGTAKAGEQIQMTYDSNVSDAKFVWCTNDEDIAVIDDYGVLTIIDEGYVTVSVYDANNVSNKNYRANYYLYIEGEVEVDYISRLIHTALKENGTKETGSNVQKYGAWYPNNGEPWCAMFVSWCWHFSGLSNELLLKYQGCYAGMKWCTEQGIMHFVQDYTFGETLENGASSKQYKENYKPQAGDIVFFLSAGMGHTGIVIHSDDTYLYTIEGNTSDMVDIKRWSLNDARITGYASPKYPEYSKPREDFSWIAEKKDDGTYWWTKVSEQQKVD